ncbi:hypothetical protein [Helicobacter pylori]
MFLLRHLTSACVFLASKCLPDSFVLVALNGKGRGASIDNGFSGV